MLQDLIPYLVLHQHASTKAAAPVRPDSSGTPSANGRPEPGSMAASSSTERLPHGASFCLCLRQTSMLVLLLPLKGKLARLWHTVVCQ